jgi:hypothetical protein
VRVGEHRVDQLVGPVELFVDHERGQPLTQCPQIGAVGQHPAAVPSAVDERCDRSRAVASPRVQRREHQRQ